MSAEELQVAVSIAGLILATIGLPILYIQIRELQRSVRSGAHATMYAQGADFRAHLVKYPHLRKYFFDGEEISPDHEDYARVVTLAELFLNHLEHIAVMADSFGTENRASLERFCRNAFDKAPILRRRLEENPAAYSHTLLPFLAVSPAKRGR